LLQQSGLIKFEEETAERGGGGAFGVEDLPSNKAGVEFEEYLPDKVSGLTGAIEKYVNEKCGGFGPVPANLKAFNRIRNFGYDGVLDPNGSDIKVWEGIKYKSSGDEDKDKRWLKIIKEGLGDEDDEDEYEDD